MTYFIKSMKQCSKSTINRPLNISFPRAKLHPTSSLGGWRTGDAAARLGGAGRGLRSVWQQSVQTARDTTFLSGRHDNKQIHPKHTIYKLNSTMAMDVERLIECVKKHVFLYDLGHSDYKNTTRKAAVWEKIAVQLNENSKYSVFSYKFLARELYDNNKQAASSLTLNTKHVNAFFIPRTSPLSFT